MRWNDFEEKLLTKEYEEGGASIETIAAQLQRAPDSVKNKVERLMLRRSAKEVSKEHE